MLPFQINLVGLFVHRLTSRTASVADVPMRANDECYVSWRRRWRWNNFTASKRDVVFRTLFHRSSLCKHRTMVKQRTARCDAVAIAAPRWEFAFHVFLSVRVRFPYAIAQTPAAAGAVPLEAFGLFSPSVTVGCLTDCWVRSARCALLYVVDPSCVIEVSRAEQLISIAMPGYTVP